MKRSTRGVARLPGGLGWAALTTVIVGATALSPMISVWTTSSPVPPLPKTWGSPLAVAPKTTYDTGLVSVVLQSPLPRVQLFQDSNHSVGATLAIVQVAEIASTIGNTPPVVAAAFPLSLAYFNGSGNASATVPGAQWGVNLSADLAVLPVQGTILGASASDTVTGPPVGAAQLQVTYNLASLDSGLGGVILQWSVVGWPWLSGADLLAVEFMLDVFPSQPFVGCTSDGASTVLLCGGPAISPGAPSWDARLSGVQSAQTNGSWTEVRVNTTVNTTSGLVPVHYGVFAQSNGSIELLVAAHGSGSGGVGSWMSFTLGATLPSLPIPSVRAAPLPYLLSAVATAIVAAVLVVAYRWWDARLREKI